MSKKCVKCGASLEDAAVFCDECGEKQPVSAESTPNTNVKVSTKKRITAILLALFLGGFGIHNFYLGFHVKGVIQLLLSVFCLGVGGIWAFVEMILLIVNKINVDASGATLQ